MNSENGKINDMKQKVVLLLWAVCLMSCNTEVWQMSGEYSYKTSGRVEIENADTTIQKNLPDEIGVLHILSTDRKSEEVVLTMNQLGGSVVTTHGMVEGNRIELENFERTLKLQTTLQEKNFVLQVGGYGERYENTIVFTLEYDGESEDGEYTLSGEDIRMVATWNY